MLSKIINIVNQEGIFAIPSRILRSAINRFRVKLCNWRYGFINCHLGIKPFVYGLKNCKIGANFYAERYFRFEIISSHGTHKYKPVCTLGDNVRVSDFVHIGCCNKLIIGNNVLIGSKVLISDHGHGIYTGSNQSRSDEIPNNRVLQIGEIQIGNNVFIGDGAVILPDVKIGDGAVIAANAVLVSGTIIPDNCIAAGIPAKAVKIFDNKTNSWVKINKN